MSKKDKIIKIVKESFKEKGFCTGSLGNMKCYIDNFNYEKNTETTNIIKKIGNKYFLLLKYTKEIKPVSKEDINIEMMKGDKKII